MAEHLGNTPSRHDREAHGLNHATRAYWNLSPAMLYEHAVRRNEGMLTADGAFATVTAPHTGRSPRDKFLVREATSEDDIWWGDINQPFDPERFDILYERMIAHLKDKDVYVSDQYACADEAYRLNIRTISENAWQNLFNRNMLLRPGEDELADMKPGFTLLHMPSLSADPEVDGTSSQMFVLVHFERKLILLGGSRYGGEIKKAIFTVLNYLLPKQGVLSMHCSANVGPNGDTALFFGLSGTGKTTLSANPERGLIGDDEHGWGANGIFNFEGGSYAKVIRLSAEGEPDIYTATHRFGTIVENVVVDKNSGRMDLNDATITENTRASYPIDYIRNAVIPGVGGHPKNVVFLTADAFGVMPPIARLTPNQAMYHFLAGYTAKVAGTERGIDEPQATFSACFGEPFLPLPPTTYAEMLGQKLEEHGTKVWMVNTGWTGGPFGVGHRMELAHTRTMVQAALSGALDDVEMELEPVFGFQVPAACPGVPSNVLMPRRTWSDGTAYDEQAQKLAGMFVEHFARFEKFADDGIMAAAPSVS